MVASSGRISKMIKFLGKKHEDRKWNEKRRFMETVKNFKTNFTKQLPIWTSGTQLVLDLPLYLPYLHFGVERLFSAEDVLVGILQKFGDFSYVFYFKLIYFYTKN